MSQQINISFISKDKEQLAALKKAFPNSKDVKVESAELESIPGAIETLSVLGVTISVVAGIVSQVAGAWIYELFKKKKGKNEVEVFVNGNRVATKEDIEKSIGCDKKEQKENKNNKEKKGDKKKKSKKNKKSK